MTEALQSSWISGGPFVDRLEKELGALLGSSVQVVSNGTAALHLAYLGLDLPRGATVSVPAFAFQAAANVAMLAGLRPVFHDVDPGTWCATAESIEASLTRETRAIVAVHTYGNVCPMASIAALARSRRLHVVEDAAESLGSTVGGVQSGTIGDIGTFSFHATKTITTGEGGAVATRDPAIAERMALFRSHGLRRKVHYWHEVPGHNFRLTNLQAALGCAQLAHLQRIVDERRRVYESYRSRLSGAGFRLQEFAPDVEPVVWAVAAALDADAYPQGRDAVLQQMEAAGIECRPGFYTPAELGWYDAPRLPVAERLAASVLSVPSFPTLTEAEIDRVCSTLLGLRR